MWAGTWMLVAAALSASPAEEWGLKVCPEKPPADESNMARKEAEGRRGVCLKREMNRALDAILLPLKKAQPPSFRSWMQAQADFNRWQAQACNLTEHLAWLSLQEGTMSSGTMSGYPYMGCEQRLLAERGWFAVQLQGGKRTALLAWQEAARKEGEGVQRRLKDITTRVQALAKAPVQGQPEVGSPLGAEGARELLVKLEAVQQGATQLAAAQCQLSFPEETACPERLRLVLLSGVGTTTMDDEGGAGE